MEALLTKRNSLSDRPALFGPYHTIGTLAKKVKFKDFKSNIFMNFPIKMTR